MLPIPNPRCVPRHAPPAPCRYWARAAPAILTEDEWVLDGQGAAAMVLGDPIHLALADTRPRYDEAIRLSFCTPSGLTAEWLDVTSPRIGAVSGDIFGHGPFRVWSGGRVVEAGAVEAVMTGVRGAIAASQGVRALTAPIEIAEAQGYELKRLGGYPAFSVLMKSLPQAVRQLEQIPLHMLMGAITFGDPNTAIRDGRYRLNHIVAANPSEQTLTLSQRPNRGERLFWAMRDALAAERDMRTSLARTRTDLGEDPQFALLFPCMGRGPQFFGNRDRDLELLKSRFPGLPVIGFYGNGEIGPLDGVNHLYQYSAIVGLFALSAP
ncbi:MAG: FIST C-terminal domain-containing protein [Pseudomonadota bacterium]|nr:MAG: FIST C-terminal domain-containing protein [Pseudomonadota bacterium]